MTWSGTGGYGWPERVLHEFGIVPTVRTALYPLKWFILPVIFLQSFLIFPSLPPVTAQIPDTFLLQDHRLSLVGVNGQGLFDPRDHDLQPVPRITSCWRGYVCTYKTVHNKFLLDSLQVNLQREGPAINEIQPVFSIKNTFDNTYSNLNLSVDFSGGILAAGDFIQQLYVHMGFHPAWKYQTVFELVISQGCVIETRNVSKQMERIRDAMINSPLEPGANATQKQIEEWVAATFRLDYNL
jgi:hypothetical protein